MQLIAVPKSKHNQGGNTSMVIQLPESEARAMLERGKVARLGCIVNGDPYIVPINYFMKDGRAYSHSLPGLKVDALRLNPRACLQADEINSDFEWRSVIGFGEFEEITEPSMREQILGQLLLRFPRLTPVEAAIATDIDTPPIIVFAIKIERVTAVGE
ncbi:MAG: pyridoxamine 5'-phosphate oxidase [Blastocatellia bacterium]|nr:MAG: pyridoxamine 5'-phosphate oxidase [Blastocatellia bacterium]